MKARILSLFLLLASSAIAQSVINPPPGVGPCQPYRILFVTDGSRTANSADIAVYDNFVASQAAADPELAAIDTTWRAVASTASVDARDHTETTWTTAAPGIPIYRPDGVLIAVDYANLWSVGSADPLVNEPWSPFNTSSTSNNRVWTGTDADGTAASNTLGDVSGQSACGDPETVLNGWTYANNWNSSVQWPLYGISDVLVYNTVQHPEGLQPGDQYRVMFVTDGLTNATSDDFAYYDAFVSSEATAATELNALGTTWRAVVSVPTGGARVHTETTFSAGDDGVPIYRPDGKRIADHHRHLWRVSTYGPLVNKPEITATGLVSPETRVWTGTATSGNINAGVALGDPSGNACAGQQSAASYAWIWANTYVQGIQRPVYGISAVLTVPVTAVEDVRVGTPPNPSAFLPGQTSAPVIGHLWDPLVDHATFVSNAALDFAFFGNLPSNVSVPGLGTALVDQVFGNISVVPGATFDVAIPNSGALAGTEMSVQAMTLDWDWGLHLANAIDITIGTH